MLLFRHLAGTRCFYMDLNHKKICIFWKHHTDLCEIVNIKTDDYAANMQKMQLKC